MASELLLLGLMTLRLSMNNLSEQELVEHGFYCEELLSDPRFNELVKVCSDQFAINILEHDKLEDRELVYNSYQGLKAFLALATQFVAIKDQIREKAEAEQNKDKD